MLLPIWRRLEDLREALRAAALRSLDARAARLRTLRESLQHRSPHQRVLREATLLGERLGRLERLQRSQLDGRRSRVATLAGRLDAMSPLRVLARGYALAFRASGALLLAADDAHPGERLHLELARGALDVQVVRRARSRRGADGEAPIDREDGER